RLHRAAAAVVVSQGVALYSFRVSSVVGGSAGGLPPRSPCGGYPGVRRQGRSVILVAPSVDSLHPCSYPAEDLVADGAAERGDLLHRYRFGFLPAYHHHFVAFANAPYLRHIEHRHVQADSTDYRHPLAAHQHLAAIGERPRQAITVAAGDQRNRAGPLGAP